MFKLFAVLCAVVVIIIGAFLYMAWSIEAPTDGPPEFIKRSRQKAWDDYQQKVSDHVMAKRKPGHEAP